MGEPGNPQYRVKPFTLNREEYHERLQPQGGRRIGTRRSHHQRSRRAPGKRDSGIHQVFERRGCSGRAHPLDQGAACGIDEAGRVRQLYGAAAPAQVAQLSGTFVSVIIRRPFVRMAMILILLFAILLVSSCGHPKQARVDVLPPPPPPVATTAEPPAESAPANVAPRNETSIPSKSAKPEDDTVFNQTATT